MDDIFLIYKLDLSNCEREFIGAANEEGLVPYLSKLALDLGVKVDFDTKNYYLPKVEVPNKIKYFVKREKLLK